VTWLEWHLVALFFFALGLMFWPLLFVSLAMWSASAVLAVNAACKAVLPKAAPWWCRPLVGILFLLQPPIRAWYRTTYDLRMWRPHLDDSYYDVEVETKVISTRDRDLYWFSDRGLGREKLLHRVVEEAKQLGWLGVFNNGWATWDVKLVGDLWHNLILHTASEELGSNRRFTRARITSQPTVVNRVLSVASLIWSAAALVSLNPLALVLAMFASAAVLMRNVRSRHSCLRAAAALVARAGLDAGLKPVDSGGVAIDSQPSRSSEPQSSRAETPTPEVV
jgi:hypothetical protein